MSIENVFFDLQRQAIDGDLFREGNRDYHDSWFREDTVDFWRHKRMYETCRAVATHYRNVKWLTVGDGRYGLDSVRLRKLFSIQTILPTDLGSYLLERGRERRLFDEYRVENAEHLTFSDN